MGKKEGTALFSSEGNAFSLPDGGEGYEEAKRLLEASQMDITKSFFIVFTPTQLHARIEELETELESSNADQSKLKSKYSFKFQEVEATRQNICELEVQLQAYSTDIENLRRENRSLVKENMDLSNRIEREGKNMERLRSEWSSREGSLIEQLRQQRQDNKMLKSQNAMYEKQLETAINSDCAAESSEMEELRNEVKRSENKIHQMSLELTEAQKIAGELEARLRAELDVSSNLREQRDELSTLNASLMEDAENFQTLYEQHGIVHLEEAGGGWRGEEIRRGSEDSGRKGSLADEITSCSGRSSPVEKRSLSVDTVLTALNPLTGNSYDLEIAHLKHKINGYEDLIEKLLHRIREDDDDFEALDADKKAALREKTRQLASQIIRDAHNGRRLSWFFGSKHPLRSPTTPSSSKSQSQPRLSVDTRAAQNQRIDKEDDLISRSPTDSLGSTTSSSASEDAVSQQLHYNSKFDAVSDAMRLSSRLEKVVSRSSSMNFAETQQPPSTPRKESVVHQQAYNHPQSNPGLMRRIWRGVSWIAGAPVASASPPPVGGAPPGAVKGRVGVPSAAEPVLMTSCEDDVWDGYFAEGEEGQGLEEEVFGASE
ncbi:hypothetical protein HDU67_001453 [Dinochytrium kinnereticum]|nr:hypothetical protein HDU67_001453 [Dinochytrium kinnereticum]